MKEGHLAYLACSSVIMESLVEGHLIWLHRAHIARPCKYYTKQNEQLFWSMVVLAQVQETMDLRSNIFSKLYLMDS